MTSSSICHGIFPAPYVRRDLVIAPDGTPGKVVAVEGDKVTVSFGMTALNGDALDGAVGVFAADKLRPWRESPTTNSPGSGN